MYTQENYLWGLIAYGVGILLMLPLLWRLTRAVIPWSSVRMVTRLFLAAFFLTPVKAYNDLTFMAPAWVVAGFEIVRPTTEEGFVRALVPIIFCFVLLLIIYVGWLIFMKVLKKKGSRAVVNQEL